VLWNDNGDLQIRSPAGSWSRLISLGLAVHQVLPDAAGLLVSGTRYLDGGTAQHQVLLLDPEGTILERWTPGFVLGIASSGDKRWATIFGDRPRVTAVDPDIDVETTRRPMADKLVALAGAGRVEERERIELDARIAAWGAGDEASVRVDCVPANDTKSHYHPPYCVAGGTRPWRKVGVWDRLPFPCGKYLIEVQASRALPGARRDPEQTPRLTIRRLEDGAVAMTRSLRPEQIVTCGGTDELVVGLTDVQAWSLPELELRWRARSTRGKVTALARAGDQVLVATASGALETLQRR
jgi:hypothetical protein